MKQYLKTILKQIIDDDDSFIIEVILDNIDIDTDAEILININGI